MDIFLNALLQIAYIMAPLLLVGLFVALCYRIFTKISGATGYRMIFYTSMLGTPIHELSHAFMCILFGHHILDMKLLSFDPSVSTLGYVKHSFNKHSLFQRIGNFFIALAPMFGGCAIFFAGLWLLPSGIKSVYDLIPPDVNQALSASDMYVLTVKGVWNVIRTFFSAEMVQTPWWWLYLVIGLCISLHINLGQDDFEDSGSGFILLCILIIIANFICGLLDMAYLYEMNRYLLIYNTYMTVFLTLAVVFSLFMVCLAAVIFGLRSCFVRKEKV